MLVFWGKVRLAYAKHTFWVARHAIDGGTHQMSADKNFGIVVYGFGSYTSYMYPGGLDFEEINPLI